MVWHTWGPLVVGALAPAAVAGARRMALHPAMTFTGRSEDVERLATACVAITAGEQDEAGFYVAEALTLELGAEPVRVPERSRKLYHAALTHGANHLITLVNECAQLLREAGVATPERVMAPLLSASLDNSLRHGDRAATGPVARGDSGTVRAHLDALDAADPAVVPGYVELAKRTAERAVRSGMLRSGDAAEVRDVLDGEQ